MVKSGRSPFFSVAGNANDKKRQRSRQHGIVVCVNLPFLLFKTLAESRRFKAFPRSAGSRRVCLPRRCGARCRRRQQGGPVSITCEAVGPIAAPQALVSPVSAIAPGLSRKFIRSPGCFDPYFIPRRGRCCCRLSFRPRESGDPGSGGASRVGVALPAAAPHPIPDETGEDSTASMSGRRKGA